jgi:hypothetical protein
VVSPLATLVLILQDKFQRQAEPDAANRPMMHVG